jgi:PleD family two-component response regulator
LLKRSKTERTSRTSGPDGVDRVLVVDDHPEAARLLGRILRRAGFEVAELTDPHAVIEALLDEPRPVGAVVASFTTSGTRACLRLLDNIRSHDDPRISDLRVLLVSDQPRQQIFCFQAGADAILLRPYHAAELTSELRTLLERADRDRAAFRSTQIERLTSGISHPLDPRGLPTAVAGH